MIHFHPLRVAEVRPETDDCVTIRFEAPGELTESFHYLPGQYLTLRTHIDGEEVRRSYSLCSAPYEGEMRVAVKKVEGGRFSTWANEQLKAGETLEVMPPQGRFVVRTDAGAERQFVLYAAGSGITPVISILKAVLRDEPNSRVTLFYGNRNIRSVMFIEELAELKNRYLDRLSLHYIFSREHQSSPLFEGRLDAGRCLELLKVFVPNFQEAEHYICGPEAMIHEVIQSLEEQGIPESRRHFELFTSPVGPLGAADAVREKEATTNGHVAKVQVRLDGRVYAFELPYNGQNILDASMVTGADLPFSCKGGVCCTCRAKLLEGQVEMEVNYALEPWEVKEGFILTCQSHPRTPEIFVDFDQQ